MNKCKLLAVMAGVGVAFSTLALSTASAALADPPKDHPSSAQKDGHKDHHKQEAKTAEIGQKAPAFTLTDTDGKKVNLADFAGKVVVLEWFNPDCPIIMQHHKTGTTFNDLHKEFADKGVVFLAINSTAKGKLGSGLEHNKEAKAEFKLPYPLLLDESGDVGRLYGAKKTPHCFVIDKNGTLAYDGAIDNNTEDKAKAKNYVANAVNQLLRGETVTETKTKPYGCGIKY